MSAYRQLVSIGVSLSLLLAALPLCAQQDRDPTVAPPETGATTSPSPIGAEGMSVMARDGKLYLVVGTRWYGVGDKVGIMRIDRISETEVWLHDGVKLIKMPRFAGIQRTAVVAKPACPVAPAPDASTAVAPVTAPLSDNAIHAIGNARNDRPPFDTEPKRTGKTRLKRGEKATTGVVDPASNPISAVAPCEDASS